MKIRVMKNNNYTVMSNYHLRDKMTLKAKGLLSLMLSLPDDWDYSIEGLVAISVENETAIKSALKELMEHGYLIRKKYMPNETASGRIEYEYIVFELPYQGSEKETDEKQPLGNLYLGNHGQLNTYIQSIENKNDISSLHSDISKGLTKKEENISTLHSDIFPKKKSSRFVKPTIDEVAAYCRERKNSVDPEAFVAYYESKGWMVGRSPMKDWKQAVITFEKNQKRFGSPDSSGARRNGNSLDPHRKLEW